MAMAWSSAGFSLAPPQSASPRSASPRIAIDSKLDIGDSSPRCFGHPSAAPLSPKALQAYNIDKAVTTDTSTIKSKPLGQGAFGTVRAATFRGLPVAVKTMILAKDADRAAKLESINDFKLEVGQTQRD